LNSGISAAIAPITGSTYGFSPGNSAGF
jgi:hypothetical protein